MKIALVLTPPTDQNFRWAAQIGVTDFVARYQMVETPEKLTAAVERAARFGLRLSVVEGYLPLREVVLGTAGRDAQIEEVARLIAGMGRHGVEILCYNFMQSDWTRTAFRIPTRGGALTNEFRLAALEGQSLPREQCLSAEQLWANYAYFLQRILPVAQANNVQLAMHPDDPPLPSLLGASQMMYSAECYDRLFAEFPSPANAMCFCQGTFAEMGADIPATIRHFGPRIAYVHFRDVRGNAEHFVETFHDDGPTDMAAAMRAYREIGFRGAMRPDHVPALDGEANDGDGYSMLGRLFAVGYMRGLMHATENRNGN